MPSISSSGGGGKIMNGIHNAIERLSAPTPGSPPHDSVSNGDPLNDRCSAPGYASAAPPAADSASVVSAPAGDMQQAPPPPAMPCCDWPDQVQHVESSMSAERKQGAARVHGSSAYALRTGTASDASVCQLFDTCRI